MTGYLLAALSCVALAGVTVAGVQSTRLASARSDLATAESDLVAARSAAARLERDHAVTVTALAAERSRADAVAVTAQSLRDRIARDVGTDRDGPTAPVLRDAIQGLTRTGTTAEDGMRYGDDAVEWRLIAVLAGHVDRIVVVAGQKGCDDAMLAIGLEYEARGELDRLTL